MSEYQRQSYISNYLDGGTDRNDIIYGKVKTTNPNTHEQNQNLQIKTASYADSHRHQFSRTVPDWSSGIARYEYPQLESNNSYTMEQASQSCMYPNTRGCHQHFVNHAKSQLHWFRDQDPTMRSRPSFTSQQTRELEEEFSSCQYISRRRRNEIAFSLNLTEKQIKTWFQNRRVKERKTRKPTDHS